MLFGDVCHFIDLAIYFAAEPAGRGPARFATPDPGHREESWAIKMRFANGGLGAVHYVCGSQQGFERETIDILGGGRSARIAGFRALTLRGGQGAGAHEPPAARPRPEGACSRRWSRSFPRAPGAVDHTESFVVSAQALLAVQLLDLSERRVVLMEPRLPLHAAAESHRPDGRDLPARRVLMVGPLPLPLGGVQLMNQMLIRSSLGARVRARGGRHLEGQLRWAVETPTWNTPLYFVRDFARLLRGSRALPARIVYVHAAPSLSFLRDWLFMATARLAGAKVVCHYHGTVHTKFPVARDPQWPGHRARPHAAAHHVIVLGPTYRREMGEAWHRDDARLVTQRGRRRRSFATCPPAEPAPWLAPGERAVLFVGRLSAPKGIFDLFDAIPRVIERHPEARFVLVGVAENDAREPMLRAEAERRGITSRVTFLRLPRGPR